ncbi:diguanylate cyclase (GGDEF)-like protein/PAS domain S-box-containing protein [Peteryoungia aggregata LMG 23059]|uniref:Diguanylate cyclase (GGDEF)-like protein/PAS domain S-box-containing protein n=1 Tax=Peteryoungia aggregata LMG 23059 TaxID=1368425 RepID=A0ABU0GCU2_9HYPH|nr:EAL domain-containing protein [Peteryoungia aggregata]MDQ0423168.1 diguanylate cyclase (GGDEF)-like protein/PAS domain S-box-containing protein [Peteryoungia aggregata LMG 23059]
MTRSVESRFLAIVGITISILVVPLFALFLSLATERASSELQQNLEILIAANAQALAKPLWDFDQESVEQITATIVSNATVSRVNVKDMSGGIAVSMPALPKWPKNGLESISREIFYRAVEGPKLVGTITIYYSRIDMFSSLRQAEVMLIGIFMLAVMGVVGAAVAGNRLMVMKPLLKLTAAIEATRRLGSRHHVDWQSNDEIGRLARSFNAMQIKLEQEEGELRLAHRRSTDIYNTTPAMLFSLDEEDRITGVSDYWLVATGYQRHEIIGRKFIELVPTEARADYLEGKKTRSIADVLEATTRFACADGTVMDVLIAEADRKIEGAEEDLSLSVMTDVTALKQSEERNHRQAITDHLTGLRNRKGFETALDGEIAATDAAGEELACIFVDLDRFKWINDNLGHQAGDLVLCRFVERMKERLPKGAVAARLGGDEFAVLLRGRNIETVATELSHSLCDIFVEPMAIESSTVRLSASIGIALYPRHAANAAELLQKSDMAMYSKKRDGKNGAQLYDPQIQDHTRRRAEIERDIEEGLAEDWFDAFFQPIVEVGTGRTVGYEALMRLVHPERGIVPPAELIGVAEETGAISRLGGQVLEKALSNLARLSAMTGDHDAYLAVNFSPLQFDASLPVRLAALSAHFDIAPSRIVIEITEATLLHDNPQIRTILDEFNHHGYRLALDDFGTGYSSLSYLNRFPVDIVKIDQSFIRSLTEDEPELRHKSRMLVEGITAISHKMQCTVVAEGIETEEQRHILEEFGVDYGQGYHFARPQALSALIEQASAKPARRAKLSAG